MNDAKTRLQKIDKVCKEPYAATRWLSWQNESRIWQRSIRTVVLWPGSKGRVLSDLRRSAKEKV